MEDVLLTKLAGNAGKLHHQSGFLCSSLLRVHKFNTERERERERDFDPNIYLSGGNYLE